jgi:hypothetical protein
MRTTATASNYRRQVASVLARRLLLELSAWGSDDVYRIEAAL